jgi:hypothetical protein
MLPVYPSHEYPSHQQIAPDPLRLQQTWNPLLPSQQPWGVSIPLETKGLFENTSSSQSLPNLSSIKYFDSYDERENFSNDMKGKIMISSDANALISDTNKARCPLCLKGSTTFKLPNDPTTTVFCNDCRNPYHFCPIHKKPIAGLGKQTNDTKQSYTCQCNDGQSFLNHDRWDQCFNA